ncbi:hypothetical protein HII31_02046 [Pseudocercospora fuligena]|uniref:Uncharacterized protein n=1 Tax=Pseudocercospora fuligena TaxID=685502 RepID=A0A8H6RT59_9PEZI|nr:hypothetical protein HII31_02046 [Pseudocercospora fuligena]
MTKLNISTSNVAELLSSLQDLETIILEWGDYYEGIATDSEEVSIERIMVKDFLPELLLHRETLENLALHNFGTDVDDRVWNTTPMSLREFENLVYLEIDHRVIAGRSGVAVCDISSLLPGNLESLILHTDIWFKSGLTGVLEVLSKFPSEKLSYVEVTFLIGVSAEQEAKMPKATPGDGRLPLGLRYYEDQQDYWVFWRSWGPKPWENARDYLRLIEACGLEALMDGTAEAIEIGTASTMAPWPFREVENNEQAT